jgi:hypothetical protein
VVVCGLTADVVAAAEATAADKVLALSPFTVSTPCSSLLTKRSLTSSTRKRSTTLATQGTTLIGWRACLCPVCGAPVPLANIGVRPNVSVPPPPPHHHHHRSSTHPLVWMSPAGAGLYPNTLYNNISMADDTEGYVAMYNRIVGAVELRQFRVRNDSCYVRRFKQFGDRCVLPQ